MDGWLVWLLVACGLGAGEVLSGSSFYLAPFAVGAVLAAGADSVVDGLAGWIVFFAASILTVTWLRPLVMRRLQSGPAMRTGAAALVGRQGVVLERIANHEGVGRVRIDHEVWTARSLDEAHVIEVGAHVEIVDIKGATALVME